jgi:hypothetical protein
MTRTTSVSVTTLQILCAAWLGAIGCSSSNNPAYTGVGGNAASTTGGSSAAATGGVGDKTTGGAATATGGVAASTGGAGNSTTGGAGNSTTGGAGNSTTGGAGNTTTGGAGNTTTGGASTSAGGSTSSSILPGLDCSSKTTAAGLSIGSKVACTAADTQLCYKTCGPDNVGYKSETCTAGAYVESTCAFPATGNYSCFKATVDSAGCPATAPTHGQPCTITQCTLPCTGTACATCGFTTGYMDSSGNPKAGYCVCIPGTAGASKWSCASSSAWPCPASAGCS